MNIRRLVLVSLIISLPIFIYSMTLDEQLIEAIDNDDLQQVQAALDAGAHSNVNCGNSGCAALHVATYWGNVDIIKLLLHYNAYINIRTNNGYTPLHVAIDSLPIDKRSSVIIHLIEANANVNMQNNAGWTPLHMAAHHYDNITVRLLLANGADPLLKDKYGNTALDIAKNSAKNFDNQELVQLLSEIPPLKNLSMHTIKELIKQKQLNLDQVKTTLPVDLHDSIEVTHRSCQSQ